MHPVHIGIRSDNNAVVAQGVQSVFNVECRLQQIEYFIFIGMKEFSRKDYQRIFKNLSTATASRDLKKGVLLELFSTYGERNGTRYRILV